MQIDRPAPSQIPSLLQLWKSVFGDHGGFWEMFLDTAFEADHCRCITLGGKIAAALYWFDCQYLDRKIAYIYGVVTHPDHRGKGLCKALLAEVHNCLSQSSYDAAMLVPEKEALRHMYRKLGYTDCTSISAFSCSAGPAPIPLRAIGPEAYAALRREFLPRDSVIQEGKNLDFLAQQAQFYTGNAFLLAAYTDSDVLHALEFLGPRDSAPGILSALGCRTGHFRVPGSDTAFAMIHPLTSDAAIPHYFGFAFD